MIVVLAGDAALGVQLGKAIARRLAQSFRVACRTTLPPLETK